MSAPRRAVADAQRRRCARRSSSTSSSATGADRDQRRDRHAALAGRAEARVDRGVGGEVEVGVGQHDHVVLRAAERLHALAVRGAGLVDVPRDRGRADERHRLARRGASSSASTATLSPCTTLNTPSGSPASAHSSASAVRRRRVLLARLEHHGVAARDRDREEPHRHHRREVERADDRRPRRAAGGSSSTSTPVETPSEKPPLSRCGMPHANSTTSRPRVTSPSASESTLPCSAVMSAASLLARVEQLAEGEQHLRALGQRGSPATPAQASCARRTTSSTVGGRGEVDVGRRPGRSPGRRRRRCARRCPPRGVRRPGG